MPNAAVRPRLHLRYDDLFFSGMAAVALIVVLVGFARTYFLAGLFRAPLPNLLEQRTQLLAARFAPPRRRKERSHDSVY